MSSLQSRRSLGSSCVAPEEHEKQQGPTGLKNDELLKSEMVQAWHQDLFHSLKIVSTPPKVIISEFRDARRLFGNNCDNIVTLRNPYCEGCEDIELLQFDPNFMSTEVVCRHPSCNNINPAAAKCGKRDLYLCPQHQQVLRKSIDEALAKERIQNSTSMEKPERQFAACTSLISLLEVAYHDAKKFPETFQGKSLKVQEAILNVRNFLIITSTVLNPDHDNLNTALPPVVKAFRLALENPEATERLADKAIFLLKEVMDMILSPFGVIYTWVSHSLGNPGAQIGAGVGGFIGGWSSLASGPLGGPGGVVAGSFMGGLIGNGIYNLLGGQRQQETDGLGPNRQPHNQYPVYLFHGDVTGRLDLQICEFHLI